MIQLCYIILLMYVSYQHQPHVYINGIVQYAGPELISCSFSVWYNNVTQWTVNMSSLSADD